MGTYTEIGINQVYYGDSDHDAYKNVLVKPINFRQVQKALLEATRTSIEQAESAEDRTPVQDAILRAAADARLDLDKDTYRKSLQPDLPALPDGKPGPEALTDEGAMHLRNFLFARMTEIECDEEDSICPCKRTIFRWITECRRPGTDELIFMICFALDLRARKDVEALFTGLNGCGDGGARPLHLRDAPTMAYWECLSSGKTWGEARDILVEYRAWDKDNPARSKPEPQFTKIAGGGKGVMLADGVQPGREQILEDLKGSRGLFLSLSATLRDAYLKQKADFVVPACIFCRDREEVRKDVSRWASSHKEDLEAASFGSCYSSARNSEALRNLKIYHDLLTEKFSSPAPFDSELWSDYLASGDGDFDIDGWATKIRAGNPREAMDCDMGWAEIYRIYRQYRFKTENRRGSYEYLAYMVGNRTLMHLAFPESRQQTAERRNGARITGTELRPTKEYDKRLGSEGHFTAHPFFEGYPRDEYLNRIDGTTKDDVDVRTFQARKAIILLFFLNYSMEWELGGLRTQDSYGLNDFVGKLNGRDLDGNPVSEGILSECRLTPLKSSNQFDQLLMKSIWQYEASGTCKGFEDRDFKDPENPDGKRVPAAEYLSGGPDELESKIETAKKAQRNSSTQEDRDDYAFNLAALRQKKRPRTPPSKYFDAVLEDLLIPKSQGCPAD